MTLHMSRRSQQTTRKVQLYWKNTRRECSFNYQQENIYEARTKAKLKRFLVEKSQVLQYNSDNEESNTN